MVLMGSSNIGRISPFIPQSRIFIFSYSDFLVNEITEDGVVIHLTDLSCPEFDGNKSVSLTVKTISGPNWHSTDLNFFRMSHSMKRWSNDWKVSLKRGIKMLSQSLRVRKRIYEWSRHPISMFIDNFTKEQRTSIHHFVRSINVNLKSELVNNSIEVTYLREWVFWSSISILSFFSVSSC